MCSSSSAGVNTDTHSVSIFSLQLPTVLLKVRIAADRVRRQHLETRRTSQEIELHNTLWWKLTFWHNYAVIRKKNQVHNTDNNDIFIAWCNWHNLKALSGILSCAFAMWLCRWFIYAMSVWFKDAVAVGHEKVLVQLPLSGTFSSITHSKLQIN